jgi:predicted aspartyl protease
VKRYPFERWWNLIVAHAAIKGEHNIQVVRLVVDTGCSRSMLTGSRLGAIGCNPSASRQRRRVLTADAIIVVPQVTVRHLHCFGKVLEDFLVLCHTLPFNTHVDGLLGMDFLRAFDIAIHVRRGYIEVE